MIFFGKMLSSFSTSLFNKISKIEIEIGHEKHVILEVVEKLDFLAYDEKSHSRSC